MSLFDLLDDIAADLGETVRDEPSTPSEARCLYCKQPFNAIDYIVGPYYCRVAHLPVNDDGECFRIHNLRHRIRVADEVLADGQHRGNCFAHGHHHPNGGWFGYGNVPRECVEAERQQQVDRLLELGFAA